MRQRIYDGPVTEAGAALACVADAAVRLGVAADERARFLADVARALRDHHPAGTFELTAEDHRLMAVIRGGTPPERTITLAAVGTGPRPIDGTPAHAGTALLDHLIELQTLVEWSQKELEQTNKGVVALHAELAENTERLREASDLQQRSLRAERTARAAADAARSRLAFLAHAGSTLSESLDHETVLARLHSLTVPRYASAVTVWLVRGSGPLEPYPAPPAPSTATPPSAAGAPATSAAAPSSSAAAPAVAAGTPSSAAAVAAAAPASAGTPSPYVEKAYVSGRVQRATVARGDTDAGGDLDGRPGREPLLALPLISHGVTLGVLEARAAAPSFGTEDIAMFRELARLTAAAIDNALRYEHERDVAERLQRAMLTKLPPAARLEFTARYLPAEAGLNVGGDWYDAFERPDGDVIVAVGDVTGHGLQAAALMGQLRTALRAYAMDAEGPGEVLTRMHRMLSHLQPEDLATAVLAHLSPDGRLRWSNAGHPPPLLRAPDGSVTVLDGHDFLLGMPFEKATITEHGTRLTPGCAVIFYTDGLIERRDASLDHGIERLAAAFRSAEGDLDHIADSVLNAMLSDSVREDDTCLLIFRALPEPAVGEVLDADPALVCRDGATEA
ncbi:PP2C family protein-serine/threonine phosphatase [Actinoallomurus rhizosphaericola]|uniref:PP2C family protein-serine/threonine phosphatase n=1 Tax=Actinoallomurus rhizosphaericola TaxID=2952536 RepID=UPI0020919CAD|nr:GAF domain-containing SpoIIE family protein phosphatase [Actinoallomurus rhizosphaericola]MCO5993822.1 SpoIIE family protein phosphatase [Actinoallomurus rhizosphaericola]